MYIFIILFSITFIALYVISGVEYIKKHQDDIGRTNMKTWGIVLLKFIFLLISFFYVFINVGKDINLSLAYLLFTFPLLINYMETITKETNISKFIKITYGIGMVLNCIGIALCFTTFSQIKLLEMNLVTNFFLLTMFINLVFILAELILTYFKE